LVCLRNISVDTLHKGDTVDDDVDDDNNNNNSRTQHDYHHDTKVKPEAPTAVIEFLMLGGKTPETC
jgi:hypothetical protein